MKNSFGLVMDIGEQMLISGAEVHRVEESVARMSAALGADRADVFIITSSMILTVFCGENSYTETRRVTAGGTDIERLHRLNHLCRRICGGLDLAEARDEFASIMSQKPYPLWVEVAAYGLIAACFTLFFGGGIAEGGVALAIGLILRLTVLLSDRLTSNKIFAKFLCSFVSTALAFCGLWLGLIPTVDKVIIGNIMTLIPGIGLTNSLRDLIIGDSMTGALRLIEAVLAALAIAGGYLAFALFGGGLL